MIYDDFFANFYWKHQNTLIITVLYFIGFWGAVGLSISSILIEHISALTFVFHTPLQLHHDRLASESTQEGLRVQRKSARHIGIATKIYNLGEFYFECELKNIKLIPSPKSYPSVPKTQKKS